MPRMSKYLKVTSSPRSRSGVPAPVRFLPMLSTRPNPQVLYMLSLGNEQSSHLGALRARALGGDGGDVCWIEWSMADDDAVEDRRAWARCNPAYPARISMEYMEREFRALGPERFARERLGKSAWPSGEPGEWMVISEDDWAACLSPQDAWMTGFSPDADMGPPPAAAAAPLSPVAALVASVHAKTRLLSGRTGP